MPVTDFESAEWNEERVKLEKEVLRSVFALGTFMGCNSFTLPGTLNVVQVKIARKEFNEAPS
ncbi:hypothetical protein [Pseudomonas phage GP100]|nr:hypothetical protein [Pseudomonas phage GP100]